jgi:hypothetical protein
MTMRRAIEVVAALAARGVIKDYAITGAVAALAYVEPQSTQGLDILVSVANFDQHQSGFILMTTIESALAEMGYTQRSDVGVVVEGWPIQFIPVASDLDNESLQEAVELGLGGDPPIEARVLRPEYIVAKALSVGRLKDLARVEEFVRRSAVDLKRLRAVLERHGLIDAWKTFCLKSGRTDLIALE